MSIADLRDAFNSVAGLYGFACSKALLDYQRAKGQEWQILTFYGTGADGKDFIVRADRALASDDHLNLAKVAAQRLVDQRSPKQ